MARPRQGQGQPGPAKVTQGSLGTSQDHPEPLSDQPEPVSRTDRSEARTDFTQGQWSEPGFPAGTKNQPESHSGQGHDPAGPFGPV